MNKKTFKSLVLLCFIFIATSSVPALIAPKWALFNQIDAAIGPMNDGWVYEVIPSFDQTPYSITINVATIDKANALATILKTKYSTGDGTIYIFIKARGGASGVPMKIKYPQQLCLVTETALGSNKYFRGAYWVNILNVWYVYPLFERTAIQYFIDELNEMYGNRNDAAANVFKEIMLYSFNAGQYPIKLCPSTEVPE